MPENAIVRIAPKPTEARAVERTVAEIAATSDGRYSVDIHLRHDSAATQTFAETHVRRLEAMRRAMRSVERDVDGTWRIAPDHVERAAAFEAHRARAAPFIVDTPSAIPLDRQVATEGETWMERETVAPPPEPLRDAGFGREARAALVQDRKSTRLNPSH